MKYICLFIALLFAWAGLSAMDPLMEGKVVKCAHFMRAYRSWKKNKLAEIALPAPVLLHTPTSDDYSSFVSKNALYKNHDEDQVWLTLLENYRENLSHFTFLLHQKADTNLEKYWDNPTGFIGRARVSCQSTECVLDSLYIEPNLRHKGYGSLLLRTIGSTLIHDGRYKRIKGNAAPMHLKRNESMELMRPKLDSFYQKHGATKIKENAAGTAFVYTIKADANEHDSRTDLLLASCH